MAVLAALAALADFAALTVRVARDVRALLVGPAALAAATASATVTMAPVSKKLATSL